MKGLLCSADARSAKLIHCDGNGSRRYCSDNSMGQKNYQLSVYMAAGVLKMMQLLGI
jgi:hypothetical protein